MEEIEIVSKVTFAFDSGSATGFFFLPVMSAANLTVSGSHDDDDGGATMAKNGIWAILILNLRSKNENANFGGVIFAG